MICPNCNSQVPDGGFFCPECGMRIPQTAASVVAAAATAEPVSAPVATQPEVPVYSAPVYPQPETPSYAAPVYPQSEIPDYVPPAEPAPAKPKKEKKVKEKKAKEPKPASVKSGGAAVIVVLVILLMAAIGLNVWQYITNGAAVDKLEEQVSDGEKTMEKNAKTIADLEQTVAADEKTIAELSAQVSSGSSAAEDLNGQISDLNAKLEDLEKDVQDRDAVIQEQSALIDALEPYAANYEAILNELVGQNVGFAANHFSTNRGAIVMSMADKTKQFYLTANWPEGGTVSMELSSYAADVNFDNDSWDTGTTMTVTALEPGVCVATFSNNIDDNTFKVLIIVTE